MSELHYRIDSKETSKVRLTLFEKGGSVKRILYLSTLRDIAKTVDHAPLEILVKAKCNASAGCAKETLSFQQIDLTAPLAFTALPLLAKTGRLWLDQTRIESVEEGRLCWEAESLSRDTCRAESLLANIALNSFEWVLLSPTLLAVSGERLFYTQTSGIKWLEMGRKGPLFLEGSAKRRFCEEDLPVRWKEQPVKVIQPMPRLELCDRTGMFAKLWIEYETNVVSFLDPSPTAGDVPRQKVVETGWEKDLLEAGFLRKQVGRSDYYCPNERVFEALDLLLGVGWSIVTSQGKPLTRFSDWRAIVKEEQGELVVSMRPQLRAALAAVKEGRSIDESGAALIDRKEALRHYGLLLDETFVEEGIRLPRQRMLALASSPVFSWQGSLKEASEQLLSRQFIQTPPSRAFHGALLDYQQEGVDWLSRLHSLGFGGLLADEMGLGKTVQILAFFSLLRTNLPTLIVAPTTLLYHWKSEFHRFLPDLPLHLHHGPDRSCSADMLQGQPFLLTSYALLRQDAELLFSLDLEAVVFDESSAIKNRSTLNAKAASKLKARARFCISGTPIENRSEELVAQYDILMPDLLELRDAPEVMQKKIRPFFLRRTKEGVALQLPDKIETVSWIEMTEPQLALYEEFMQGALRRLKPLIAQDGAGAHRMEILEAILRLRQICTDPRLVRGEESGSKLEQLCIDLEEFVLERCKVLVFSQFTSMLDLIEQECGGRGWKVRRIDGSIPALRRAELVAEFQQEEGPSLLLLSLKAAGVGLNLNDADAVLLFDPWWNEAVEQQAIDRAHRLGRVKRLLIKRYLIPASIEEKMVQLKQSKQSAAREILDFDSGTGVGDLLSLLE